jgi:hypothetical protein
VERRNAQPLAGQRGGERRMRVDDRAGLRVCGVNIEMKAQFG